MLKKKMIANIKKTINRKSDESEGDNSYLIEVPFIDSVSLEIRKNIENRYRKSRVNSVYKFPRLSSSKRLTPQKKAASKKNLLLISTIRKPSGRCNSMNLSRNSSSLVKPKIARTHMNDRSQNRKSLRPKATKCLPCEVQFNLHKTTSNSVSRLQSLASSLVHFKNTKKKHRKKNRTDLSMN